MLTVFLTLTGTFLALVAALLTAAYGYRFGHAAGHRHAAAAPPSCSPSELPALAHGLVLSAPRRDWGEALATATVAALTEAVIELRRREGQATGPDAPAPADDLTSALEALYDAPAYEPEDEDEGDDDAA